MDDLEYCGFSLHGPLTAQCRLLTGIAAVKLCQKTPVESTSTLQILKQSNKVNVSCLVGIVTVSVTLTGKVACIRPLIE